MGDVIRREKNRRTNRLQPLWEMYFRKGITIGKGVRFQSLHAVRDGIGSAGPVSGVLAQHFPVPREQNAVARGVVLVSFGHNNFPQTAIGECARIQRGQRGRKLQRTDRGRIPIIPPREYRAHGGDALPDLNGVDIAKAFPVIAASRLSGSADGQRPRCGVKAPCGVFAGSVRTAAKIPSLCGRFACIGCIFGWRRHCGAIRTGRNLFLCRCWGPLCAGISPFRCRPCSGFLCAGNSTFRHLCRQCGDRKKLDQQRQRKQKTCSSFFHPLLILLSLKTNRLKYSTRYLSRVLKMPPISPADMPENYHRRRNHRSVRHFLHL